jgi:hypothetical protein
MSIPVGLLVTSIRLSGTPIQARLPVEDISVVTPDDLVRSDTSCINSLLVTTDIVIQARRYVYSQAMKAIEARVG